MTWLDDLSRALDAARLEAIFVGTGAAAVAGTPTRTVELLVRDTPLHRRRLHEVARALGCARVPLSDQVRTLQLVGPRRCGARGILCGVSSHIHSTAIVDAPGTHVGADTRIWHFTHVMAGAYIGDRCSIAQNCFIGKVRIGHGCKIQNNVSVYDGVTLEDDVFLGPSCVFTNVTHPRAHVSRKDAYARTLVCKGATVGANATILCGITIGEYAMIGAGSVVTRDVPPHAIVVGNPGRRSGWACRCGETLRSDNHEFRCRRCGEEYAELDGLLEAVPPVDPTRSTQKTLER